MQFKKSTLINFAYRKQLICLVFFAFIFSISSYGQCSMSCDDEIQVSLNQECEAEITYRMILRDPDNPYVCNPNGPSAYKVVVMDEDGVIIPSSPIITCEYVGRTLLVKVKHWYSGNSCWSKVVVEDKIAPKISNCMPLELWCNQDPLPENEGGDALIPNISDACAENCQTMSLEYVDSEVTTYTCEDEELRNGIAASLERTWTACDNIGNCRTCIQPIIFRIPTFLELDLPPSFTGNSAISCGDCDPTDLTCTGQPSLHHQNVANAFCHLEINHTDAIINKQCEGTFIIERTWAIQNRCTEEFDEYQQIIEVIDNTPPIIACANMERIEIQSITTPNSCKSRVTIPPAIITDNCSAPEHIAVITKIYKIDDTGKRRYMERVEANGGFALDLEFGKYEVYYQATDDCGNTSNNLDNTCMLVIEDDIPPTPVCNALTKLTLDREGSGIIFAKSFDSGSYDYCCIEKFEVRRMDEMDSDYMDYVEFSCEDSYSTDPLLVQLQITDCYGNSAICMIEVLIDDKTSPIIFSCADDIQVSCGEGFSLDDIKDNLLTPPVAEDACTGGINNQVIIKQDYRNQCGIGAVIFEWLVFDRAGNGPATCEQLVSFIDDTPISVIFPLNYFDSTCVTNIEALTPDRTGAPIINGLDCEVVEILFTDSAIEGDPSCITFTRTWVVTNLCDENRIIEHIQAIKVEDLEAPIIDCNGEFFDICLDGGLCARSFEVPGITVSDCSNEVNVRAEWTFNSHQVCIGDILTGTVEHAENGFISPELGPGQLWINFYATDACGNESICNRDYTIKDCQAPEVICLPGLTFNLDSTGQLEVWANDFHQEIIDNCEDCENWEYIFSFSQDTSETIRFYGCDDLGVKSVQVWVTDAYGNQNFCPVNFVIKGADICVGLGIDTSGVISETGDNKTNIDGNIFLEDGESIEDVLVNAENHLFETMDSYMTNESGTYAFEFQRSANIKISPTKNDYLLNGVSTFDIFLLRRHILGFEKLDSPYKMIAADVNHSNSITMADIVSLRRVILEIDNTFRNNTSWRFIKADYQFEDPTNPFTEQMPEYVIISELIQPMEIDFIGIKVGDLNGNAKGSMFLNRPSQSRTNNQINFELVENQIQPNTIETINFKLQSKEIQAFQLTLSFDPSLVEIIDIPETNIINKTNFGTQFLNRGVLTLSWDTPTNTNELFSFQLKVKANTKTAVSELFTINSTITPAEAYDRYGNVYQMDLVILENKYDYLLLQNQPNPFKQQTAIRFTLPAKSQGKLTILDIKGQTLKSIEQIFEKGANEVIFNDLQSTGLLYYQLETDFGVQTKKMLRVE